MEITSPVIAKEPGDCCLTGTIHSGTPRGEIAKIAGIVTYLARPKEGSSNGNILLYFPDVWGLFNNGLLIMDAFADAGYFVLGLDYFRGDPVWKHRKSRHDKSVNFDYEAWKKKHMDFANDNVPKWAGEVKATYGEANTKYAAVGYCFGAPYVCNELAGNLVTVGAFGHPAFLRESHFLNLKQPLFLSCTDIDHTFDMPSRTRALEILQTEKKQYQLQLFSGVEHGFSLRGDMSNPYERYVKEQSLKGIIEWFDFWLSRP